MPTTTRIRPLDVDECLRRLESHPTRVGRIAFVSGDGPVILPVNYRIHRGSVVFVTDPGSKMMAVVDGRRLAFEVDDVEPAWREGWSVLVRGIGREITEPTVKALLREGGLRAWAGSEAHVIEILPNAISGRELV